MFETFTGYEIYPEAINFIIEKAYQENFPVATWKEAGDISYTINLQTFEEFRIGSSTPTKVKRGNTGKCESPVLNAVRMGSVYITGVRFFCILNFSNSQ